MITEQTPKTILQKIANFYTAITLGILVSEITCLEKGNEIVMAFTIKSNVSNENYEMFTVCCNAEKPYPARVCVKDNVFGNEVYETMTENSFTARINRILGGGKQSKILMDIYRKNMLKMIKYS
jgi:hypothetical protein